MEAAQAGLSLDQQIGRRFGDALLANQSCCDAITTLWIDRKRLLDLLHYLKLELEGPFLCLYDLTAIDERQRANRQQQPEADFTLVYHLLSYDRNDDLRIKVPLSSGDAVLPSITPLWPAANWYEREVWDMFGIRFDGHPGLRRILTPPT